ncbi:hypothetical protein [Yoonia sp. 208BN28-4]|uniref:hypothetical protein n=1 Tax=Yoonia sp. 208BN28-4 TaxID=3126505 RepID=UPI00309E484B
MSFSFKKFVAVAAITAGMAACSGTGPVSSGGDGLNRNVLVQNVSGRTVFRFYGSRVTTNSWEEDILGSNVLPSGSSININFDDGTGSCEFDMKIEFADGSTRVENNVNVCVISTFTIR